MKLDQIKTARNLPYVLYPKFLEDRMEIRERAGNDQYGEKIFCVISDDCTIYFPGTLPVLFVKAILDAIVVEVELP